jgi:general stress protein YciG
VGCGRVRGEWVRGEEVERGGGERSGGAVQTDVAGHQGRRGGQVTSHMTYVWHMSSVDWLLQEVRLPGWQYDRGRGRGYGDILNSTSHLWWWWWLWCVVLFR